MGGRTRRDSARARPRRPRSRRSRARLWALVGALWGLLSWVPAILSHSYFELVGYRLGRPLTWLMPSWWTIRGFPALGFTYRDPAWLYMTLLVITGIMLGAAVALALRWLARQMRPAASRS